MKKIEDMTAEEFIAYLYYNVMGGIYADSEDEERRHLRKITERVLRQEREDKDAARRIVYRLMERFTCDCGTSFIDEDHDCPKRTK